MRTTSLNPAARNDTISTGENKMRNPMARLGRAAAMAATFLLLNAATAPAGNFYVDLEWTGTATGTAAQPFTTLGAAVAATGGSGTHNVYIAAGEYKSVAAGGAENFGTTGYSLNGTNTRLYGGYSGWDGTGSAASDFNWVDRTAPVARSLNTSTMTVVDLTSANSRAFVSTDYSGNGTIDGMAFRNSNVVQANYSGGAINLGGGGFGTVRVLDSVFENNTTTGSGGGAYVNTRSYDTASVVDSFFVDNSAGTGGGLAVRAGNGYTTVDGLVLDNNQATGNGGGLYVPGYYVNIYNSTLSGNQSAANGGALNAVSSANLYNCEVTGNTAVNGAAMGHSAHDGPSFSIENSLITGNTATDGNGYIILAAGGGGSGGNLTLLQSTLADNTAGGGIVYTNITRTGYSTTVNIQNSILIGSGTGIGIYADPESTPTIQYNDVWNVATLYAGSASGGVTSWSEDPMFGPGYYFLRGSSSLVDAGIDLGIAIDLAGAPRDASPNIGAFEAVIPEPVSISLFAALGLVCLRRQRR